VQPYAKWPAQKRWEIQAAAKKWLSCYKNFDNNSGEFMLIPSEAQHKFTWIVIKIFVTGLP